MGLSQAERVTLLNSSFGSGDYIAYSTDGSTEWGGLTRTAVGASGWATATATTPCVKANAITLTSAAASTGGAVTHFSVYSAITGGTKKIEWAPLTTSRTLITGNSLTWAPGSLTLTMPGTVTVGKPAVPPAGTILFGMTSENTAVTHAQSWAADVTSLARVPDYGSFYYHTSDTFPTADTSSLVPAPATLMVTWYGWPDSEVNAGTHDATITTRAQALLALGVPIFLRWDIEMNITSYGYEPTNGAPEGGPTFISAWRRVYGLFQAAGATNVAFAWCPNSSGPNDPNSWRPFYPGDAYVEWVGVDAYNFGNSVVPSGSIWQTWYQVIHAFCDDYDTGFGGAMLTQKPLMIGEGGSVEGGGSKPWWLTDMSGYMRMRGFQAMTWFNTNQTGSGNNYRHDTSAASAQATKEIAADPAFGGTSTVGSGYAAAVLADTPYAFWKLGELSGGYVDSSATALTGATTSGTMTRGVVTKWPGIGYGASWYGSGYVNLGVIGTFGAAMSAGFTLECVFKDGGSAVATSLFGQLNTGTTTGLQINLNTNHLGSSAGSTMLWLRNETGAQHYCDLSTAVYDGLWHHLIWVCNPGGTDAVYIDGATITPTATASPAAGTTANLGFSLFAGGRNNRGSIDQTSIGCVSNVSLYKSKLTSTRAAAHYTALTT